MDGTANTGGGGGGGSEAPSYGTPTNDSPGGSGGSGNCNNKVSISKLICIY